MKHIILVVLIVAILTTGMFLPYIHGDYDYFAVGISSSIQFAAFASLLFVPLGLVWFLMDFLKRNANNMQPRYKGKFRKIVLVIAGLTILAAALGALATHNRFSAIIILALGSYVLIVFQRSSKDLRSSTSRHRSVTPYYLVLIPLVMLVIRLGFLERVKNQSTEFVIEQCRALIQDIEIYKEKNGHYPVSLLSTIEDYKTYVSGIERFYYERNGEAYNVYFEQFSEVVGTQEFVMYNVLDEHEMTVHNQDLLRIPSGSIIRGYHKVVDLPQAHWKIFYFD